jgi:hypothetical protein
MAAKRTSQWSQKVTEGSNALDLQRGVFTLNETKDELRQLFAVRRGTKRKTGRKRKARTSR